MHIIRFKPLYQARVWGGQWLAEKFGRTLPSTDPIGESWEIVDRPEAQSVCMRTGHTLRQLLDRSAAEIMGPGYDASQPFPILVKWLDCNERLSLQVHPPSSIAADLGGEPKTECWYLADTTSGAALIVGLKKGVSRAQFEQAVREENLEGLLHRVPVHTGQSILLESGRLHAIDAGNLILEIQQNSDTTYRVYDWGRQGLDGKPRQLHLSESLKSIDFEDFEPEVTAAADQPGETILADCPLFRIRQYRFNNGERLTPAVRPEPMILSVVEGELRDIETGEVFAAGSNLLLPYAWTGSLVCSGHCTALLTDRFVTN